MPESILLCALAMLLIAATTHRLRRDAGTSDPRVRIAFRVVGGVLLAVALAHCGTALPGEGAVRLLGCVSVAAVAVVLLLSAAPAATLWPLRAVATRLGRPAAAFRRRSRRAR